MRKEGKVAQSQKSKKSIYNWYIFVLFTDNTDHKKIM